MEKNLSENAEIEQTVTEEIISEPEQPAIEEAVSETEQPAAEETVAEAEQPTEEMTAVEQEDLHTEVDTRVKLIRRREVRAALILLAGIVLTVVMAILSPKMEGTTQFAEILSFVLTLISRVLVVVGVFSLIAAMYRSAFGGPGGASVKATKKEKKAYVQKEQENYEKASSGVKLKTLLSRIPLLVWVVIVGILAVGAISTVTGAEKVLTYEERIARAVTVEATIVDMDSSYDSDRDRYKYRYKYEYTYDGQTYTNTESSYQSRGIGGTKEYTIDSKEPDYIIENDGRSVLRLGIICIAISLFVLVYSLFSVRDPDNNFSIGSLFWMVFAAITVVFAVNGAAMIADGEKVGGIAMIGIGCTLFLTGTLIFRRIFNSKKKKSKKSKKSK